MADQIPQETFDALVHLMNPEADLGRYTDAQLIELLRKLTDRKTALGRYSAELHRREWTWPRIAKELGVEQSTVHKWAREYRDDDSDSRPAEEAP